MSSRLLSPTRHFFLGSNDDLLERAESRAARSAAIRRKATASATTAPPPPDDACLSKEQIIELFQNCIKLASENKINQKNTWELKLIDHLSEIIKVETVEGDVETNFRKASCTLEAGVKIYSVRVDAVHVEAYKVLSGINRAGQEDEQETITAGENVENRQYGIHSKKESERKISPLSTLESSFEALNVKKFDVAFAVDPLYHQTSAKFDEGGAKGLLLNNLGIYGGCWVLFDSLEVPGKCGSYALNKNTADMIDILFAKEFVEQMVNNMHAKSEISPTLKEITCLFDKDNQRSQKFNIGQKAYSRFDASDASEDAFDDGADTFDSNEVGLDDSSFWNYEARRFYHNVEMSVVNENSSFGPTFHGHHEEDNPYAAYEPDIDKKIEDVATFLFQGLRFTSKQNAWAGPDHWKYQKFESSEDSSTAESGTGLNTKKQKKKTEAEDEIDFTKSLDKELLNIFDPPKNPKSLLLPVNRAPCSSTLPEDCHYQPENLVKLFLLPNVLSDGPSDILQIVKSQFELCRSPLCKICKHIMCCITPNSVEWKCMEKRRKKLLDNNSWQQNYDYAGAWPSWDNESVLSGQCDDGYIPNDVGDSESDRLVSQPHQVDKIEVQYDKTSKQVDVLVLKETLWNRVQEITEVSGTVCKGTVSFRHVLATFSVDCQAAAPKDISPHLCFICLLHLANEHGLIIHDCPSLDDLTIRLPSAGKY